jgi:probable rRNA maturation factor
MRSPGDPDPEVTIQADVELPETVSRAAIVSLARHILEAEGVAGEWHLGVQFIDDETMQAAHVEFMDIDTPTDIMTFPYEDDDEFAIVAPDEWGSAISGGDLMISVDRAAENAIAAGWRTDQELYFLIAHGMLHLLGWDDASDEDRHAMLERQTELINGWSEAPEART